MITVFLDNNIWDFLYAHKLDLAAELPREEFCIYITREAEFEIPPIQSCELKAFIKATIERCAIQTDSLFGFPDGSLAESEQRVGGWGIGRWASKEELAFISQETSSLAPSKKPKTGLYNNEADISLGARSFHAVVLSLDKGGPINNALNQGGKVVSLKDFDSAKTSLNNFIKAALL